MSDASIAKEWSGRLGRFRDSYHALAAGHEGTSSRVFTVGATRRELKSLSVTQQDLLEQAIRCVEIGLNRPSLVMCWAAFIDYLVCTLTTGGMARLHAAYPGWAHLKNAEDLRESTPEFQLIDAFEKLGHISKGDCKTLKGLLSQRNQAAHPGSQNPDTNIALGYISKIIQTLSAIETRRP